jgi:hypothetical protein
MFFDCLCVNSIFPHITKKCLIFLSSIYVMNLWNIMIVKLKCDHGHNILKTPILLFKYSYESVQFCFLKFSLLTH